MDKAFEETKAFLQRRCIANCGQNANESCICKIAQCFKEIENAEKVHTELKDECWEIVVKKCVNISILNGVGNVGQYNQTYIYDNMLNVKWCLNEYEFDLLKRGLEK